MNYSTVLLFILASIVLINEAEHLSTFLDPPLLSFANIIFLHYVPRAVDHVDGEMISLHPFIDLEEI